MAGHLSQIARLYGRVRLWPFASDTRYPADWDQRRRRVYRRDDYTCQHCGDRGGPYGNAELHADHIRPKSHGGSHDYANLQTLCRPCHDQKTRLQHGSSLDGIAGRSSDRFLGRWRIRIRDFIRRLVIVIIGLVLLIEVIRKVLAYLVSHLPF